MTSKERVKAAINHKESDRIPIDFGAMRSTGIHRIAYKNLKRYLGLQGLVKVYDIFQQLADPDPEILEKFGADVVQVKKLSPAFGIKIDKWKKFKMNDEEEYLVPEGYNPFINEKGDNEIRQGNQVLARMPKDGLYYDLIYFPYDNVESKTEIDNIVFFDISKEELDFLEKQTSYYYNSTDKAILLSFGGQILEASQMGWGYEKFYIDMALNPNLVHYWLEKLTDHYLRDLEKILNRIGKYIDIIQFGDDLGTQDGLQISIDMYRKLIKPYHMMQYQYVKKYYPEIKIFLHSCGGIFDVIPDLIEAGIDILNPVQISAKGMNPIKLKKEFGDIITFWGGGADMQNVVKFAPVDQVKNHVKELIEILSKNGGFIFNQVHNIQADIPPEKVIAIYETASRSS
jgi:uroporphyrinogen decarboxylase